MIFKDLFSGYASEYARFRPIYPAELFDFLAACCPSRDFAWDCGTGNGQAALELAKHFKKVIATDPSEKQLAEAPLAPNIEYQVAPAERTSISTGSIDLITVAQALHWFDVEKFTREVARVAKPKARLAVWCYALAQISPEIDQITLRLYSEILGTYWDPERKHVENGYEHFNLPISNEIRPKFDMRSEMDLASWQAYLRTWSALQKYQKAKGEDPLHLIAEDFEKAWGDPASVRPVNFPLFVRAGEIVL
jgi:ubiquinone/menaquinone biosynthesis C-methylase UbiE